MWGNAHNMNYSRIFMLGKSSAADFSGFFRLNSPMTGFISGARRGSAQEPGSQASRDAENAKTEKAPSPDRRAVTE
jgi:hypothetical protein